jgi:hypothetical protein
MDHDVYLSYFGGFGELITFSHLVLSTRLLQRAQHRSEFNSFRELFSERLQIDLSLQIGDVSDEIGEVSAQPIEPAVSPSRRLLRQPSSCGLPMFFHWPLLRIAHNIWHA